MNKIDTYLKTTSQLFEYMVDHHWNGQVISGPDPGIRFNARIGRFIKSYTNFIPWRDNMIYAQAQKYWIFNNWMMVELGFANSKRFREIAISCSKYLLDVQTEEGYWEYPNHEWKDRIATVEGNYAAMGLLATYNYTREEALLHAAIKWYHYAVDHIGFQKKDPGMLAINYFYNRGSMMIPNNSASALRMFAMLAASSNDKKYLETCTGMVKWLNDVQLDTGELPYGVASPSETEKEDRIHFLCYQYNAFQLLNLAEYYRLTGDGKILNVLKGLAQFIAKSVTKNGTTWYDCHNQYPDVTYYHTAIGAALLEATQLSLGDFYEQIEATYGRVISLFKKNGGIKFHSTKNYNFLTDKRSYPRYLSMILHHLLMRLHVLTNKSPKTKSEKEN